MRPRAGQFAFAQRQFRFGLDDGQRRLELVRGIGKETLAPLDHALEPRHVLVDGVDQRLGLHGQRGGVQRLEVVRAACAHRLR
ncbi:hypothetical protein D3C87_1220930 [compost metagenome]